MQKLRQLLPEIFKSVINFLNNNKILAAIALVTGLILAVVDFGRMMTPSPRYDTLSFSHQTHDELFPTNDEGMLLSYEIPHPEIEGETLAWRDSAWLFSDQERLAKRLFEIVYGDFEEERIGPSDPLIFRFDFDDVRENIPGQSYYQLGIEAVPGDYYQSQPIYLPGELVDLYLDQNCLEAWTARADQPPCKFLIIRVKHPGCWLGQCTQPDDHWMREFLGDDQPNETLFFFDLEDDMHIKLRSYRFSTELQGFGRFEWRFGTAGTNAWSFTGEPYDPVIYQDSLELLD